MNEDARWMRRALKLARNSFATPNPMVGCVLIRAGKIVGEGWTQLVGQSHAEVMALQDGRGTRARGATAYVTLEPCCHWGRTPPCSGRPHRGESVQRVVAATTDQESARVGGQGLAQLHAAGIETRQWACWKPRRGRATRLFSIFTRPKRRSSRSKRPCRWTARSPRARASSQWITGALGARQYVHLLQGARAGAVMVGHRYAAGRRRAVVGAA